VTQSPAPHDPQCLFCRIVDGEIATDVVAQDDLAVAFRDLTPQAPLHVLVVPRAHYPDVAALSADDPESTLAVIRLGARIAQEQSGGQFRFVFNSGPQAGQSVFHVHAHVLAGRDLTWPPG
jgi:histidine triad (HIT) family protein